MLNTPKSIKFIGVIALFLLALTGCQDAEPSPTPTPTRTPILPTATPTPTPTMTPTATPTITPTPTPTLPPDLLMPPQAAQPDEWPALPTDLYFLRDGRLWSWLAEGGAVEAIPIAEDAEAETVLDYRVSQDKRYIVYITSTEKVYVFDRAQWQHTFIPTSGYLVDAGRIYFAISPDAHYLVYMAWSMQPAVGGRAPGFSAPIAQSAPPTPPFGTILAIDLTDVRRPQINLGFCKTIADGPCTGLQLSPDGTAVAFADGEGIWVSQFTRTEPQLILPTAGGVHWYPRAWSEDNQWLILQTQQAAGPRMAVLNVITAQLSPLPNTGCGPDCRADVSLGVQALWLAQDTAQQGCLTNVVPGSATVPLTTTYEMCQLAGWPLHPIAPQLLPDGGVIFAHRGCGPDCPGPAPGIYAMAADHNTRAIALLDQSVGHVLWAADGAAFLHFDMEGHPTHIGIIGSAAFWDVRQWLEGAHTFHWGTMPPQPQVNE